RWPLGRAPSPGDWRVRECPSCRPFVSGCPWWAAYGQPSTRGRRKNSPAIKRFAVRRAESDRRARAIVGRRGRKTPPARGRGAWRVMSVLLRGVRMSVAVEAVHLGAVEIGGAELRRNGGESGRRENDRRGQPYERPADA